LKIREQGEKYQVRESGDDVDDDEEKSMSEKGTEKGTRPSRSILNRLSCTLEKSEAGRCLQWFWRMRAGGDELYARGV
jgi:hypothetical protein